MRHGERVALLTLLARGWLVSAADSEVTVQRSWLAAFADDSTEPADRNTGAAAPVGIAPPFA